VTTSTRAGPLDDSPGRPLSFTLSVAIRRDLTRADAISHFAVVADVIRTRAVHPVAFQAWQGQAVALSADNDPTQNSKDKARYEKLLGRPVEVISMGQARHVACLLAARQIREMAGTGTGL
jgi:hypothetical protein